MRDEKVKVSIIIPHYNQKDCLQELLTNLADQPYEDFEVILIDDCTPDKLTIDFMRTFIKDRPNWQLVQNPVNMRFVRTVNRGITLAKGEYICLLNQDTKIESTFLQRNVELLDLDPTIGGITCTMIDTSGQIWFSGGCYIEGFPINLKDDFEGVRQSDFIAGTAAFYRKEIFDRIGVFDENYIMYHEDVEFGLRVKQLTDYRLCTFSDKLVTHLILPSLSDTNRVYYDARNLILISRKYAPQYLRRVIKHIVLQAYKRLLGAFLNILTLKPLSSPSLKVRWAYAGIRGIFSAIKVSQTD